MIIDNNIKRLANVHTIYIDNTLYIILSITIFMVCTMFINTPWFVHNIIINDRTIILNLLC